MQPIRSFRLILQTDTFNTWKRMYPDHGIRQAILRKVVEFMIKFSERNHHTDVAENMKIFNAELQLLLMKFKDK